MKKASRHFVLISLLTFHFSLFTIHCQAQWIQVRGNDSSSHGASGVFDTAYTPPAMTGEFHWTDKQGNFWLYGGYNYQNGNSLWKFDPTIQQWAWIDSSGPNHRSDGASWVDTSGNFWLFGGGSYSDLWKYDLSTNHWARMKGPVVQGMPAFHVAIAQVDSFNNPAACASSVGWTDGNNNLWMFGGVFSYYDNWGNPIFIHYSDLWKFDISINNWVWMGDSTGGNGPAPRACFAHWSDSDHNLWLFGGTVYYTPCSYCSYGDVGFNDLWKYDVTTNHWWQSNLVTQFHNYYAFYNYTYPQPCSIGDTVPPGTVHNTACWNRRCDNLEFYGGYEEIYDEQEWLLDTSMWNYNINTNQWALMNKGANFPPNGENAMGWTDNSGIQWLFGGSNNYLWKYIPDSTCPAVINTYPVHCTFVANETSGCNPLTINFQSTSTNAVHYLWTFGDGDSSTLANPVHTYHTSGNFTVKLLVYNPLVCSNTQDSLIMINYITVADSVHAGFFADSLVGCNPLTVIFINQSYNAIGYLWDFGDGNTSTNVNPTHVFTNDGIYSIKLIAFGAGVCNDTAIYSNLIAVGATAHSSFHAIDTLRCDSIHFVNTSINGTSFKWYFGDGDSSTVTNPVHQYPANGYYSVTLITNYSGACGSFSDTLMRVNYIHFPYQVVNTAFNANPSNDTIGCSPLNVQFYGNNYYHNYFWDFGNGQTRTDTIGPSVTVYTIPGSYTVTLINLNGMYGCFDTVVRHDYITVYPIPTPATITQHGDTLFSSDTSGNVWYWNNAVYLSSNNYIIVSYSGCYSIRKTDTNGCSSSSDSICFNFTGMNDIGINHGVSIYPNPNDGSFTIQLGIRNYQLGIKDVLGSTVYSKNIIDSKGKETINTFLANGIYFWEIISEKESLAKGKLFIQK